MDYGKVLGRAWEITWRWKVLWILGFLASLGQGGSGTSSYQFGGDELNLDRWVQGPPEGFWAAISGVVLAIICLLFILAIVLWVASVISRGALIAGVAQVEDEGWTSFRSAWAAGRKKFWTLIGLGVLAAIPMIILVLLGIIVLSMGIAGGVGLLESEEAAGISTIVMFSLVCGIFLCCGLVPLGIVLEQIRVYGERGAILEGLGWIDAFKRGWQMIIENLGATILLWLIFFALGLVFFAITFVLMIALAAPFLILLGITDAGAWTIAPVVCMGLIAVIFSAIIRSVATVFISASWTLAFREMTTPLAPEELVG